MDELDHATNAIEEEATPNEEIVLAEQTPEGETDSVEVPTETIEAKAERLELELTDYKTKSDKANKGLLKSVQKERAKRDRLNAELASTRGELRQYSGESEEAKAPVQRDFEGEARYNLKVEKLGEDEEFTGLMLRNF